MVGFIAGSMGVFITGGFIADSIAGLTIGFGVVVSIAGSCLYIVLNCRAAHSARRRAASMPRLIS
jgi:hypothetical protein